ncbi:MAG: DUF1573 domain-containing protein [Parcubacteria group bacterium]|nr:DUF1573 domain-containing protein [Parcubacteria group bacterium]MCR4342713.1 DUF1573 domain-containing protein [Patescibacteria group bacterium]
MNKNLVTYVAGVAVVIGLVVAMALLSGGKTVNNSNPLAYSAGVLNILEENYDFGTISMADGNVSHNFEVKNESNEPVMISKVYTSCMCTTASVIEEGGKRHGEYGMQGHGPIEEANIEILPGGSVALEAVFDPAAHGPDGTGKVKRVVYLETNSQAKPKLEVVFEADVIK